MAVKKRHLPLCLGIYHVSLWRKSRLLRMRINKEIENIWFDWGRVLIDLDKDEVNRRFSMLGLPDIWHELVNSCFVEYEKGLMSTEEFRDGLRSQYDIQASDEELDWAWNGMLAGIPKEKLSLLLTLHSRYHTALLSNTNELHWKYGSLHGFCVNGCQISDYFDNIFLSYEMKKIKPDLNFFETAIIQTGVDPSKTLFVDDLESNCIAARKTGLQVLHFDGKICLEELLNDFLS